MNRASKRPLYTLTPTEVRAIRQSLGLSQQRLADRMGCSHAVVSAWESSAGRCNGPAAVLLRIWRDALPDPTPRALEPA